MADVFTLPAAAPLPLIEGGPVVDREALHADLLGEGVLAAYLPLAEAAIDGIHVVDDQLVLWPRSAVERAVAVLAVKAAPLTIEEVLDAVGPEMSERSLRQRLYEDERIVRTSRHRVGLRAWGGGEYTGVVSLMREAVATGARPLAEVAEDLARDFDVRPASVATFARAPLFVLDDGMLRLRADTEPFELVDATDRVPGCTGRPRTS